MENKELTLELRRIQRENLKLRMHMQVLVMHPEGYAAYKIRRENGNMECTYPILILNQN
jgi:hypothetical protein